MNKYTFDKISQYTDEENYKSPFSSLVIYMSPLDKKEFLKICKKIKMPNRNIYRTEIVASGSDIARVINIQRDKQKDISYDDFYKYQLLVIIDFDKLDQLKDKQMAYAISSVNRTHRINLIVVTSDINDTNRVILDKIKQNCGNKTFIV